MFGFEANEVTGWGCPVVSVVGPILGLHEGWIPAVGPPYLPSCKSKHQNIRADILD